MTVTVTVTTTTTTVMKTTIITTTITTTIPTTKTTTTITTAITTTTITTTITTGVKQFYSDKRSSFGKRRELIRAKWRRRNRDNEEYALETKKEGYEKEQRR